MRIVRRLYLYAVAFVSLEVIVWGVIWLARTVFSINLVTSGASLLAGGLSLTLVGLPVFLLHWWLAQRETRRDMEEHASRIRAIFLYGALLAHFIPTAQNGMALTNRMFLSLFRLDYSLALIGQGQTWADNLVAILVNGIAGAYFFKIVLDEWKTVQPLDHLADMRRLQRYIWLLYSLGVVILGVQQLVRFILYVPGSTYGVQFGGMLASGLALILVGLPLWLWTSQRIEELLQEPGEQESLLRRVILYLLALAGVTTVLSAAGIIIATALRWVFGEANSPANFINQTSASFSIGIPLAGVWGYYGRRLTQEVAQVHETPRRAALRRLYFYILSAIGLVTTFIGLRMLLLYFIQVLISTSLNGDTLRIQLANALAILIAGLPLWLLSWRPMQREASQAGDNGDHARRSILRKVYLYLVLFAGIIGMMTSAGEAIYPVLNTILGNRPVDFAVNTLNWLMTLILFSTWTWYHFQALRSDGRLASQALAAQHARFPVIMIEPDGGEFGQEFIDALQRQAPNIPVVLIKLSQGIPGEGLSTASLVVLPAILATQPPEALRIWLDEFQGQKLVIPLQSEGWQWLGHASSQRELAQQAALAARQMAEGQPVRLATPLNPWMVIGYLFAAILVLLVLLILASSIFRF